MEGGTVSHSPPLQHRRYTTGATPLPLHDTIAATPPPLHNCRYTSAATILPVLCRLLTRENKTIGKCNAALEKKGERCGQCWTCHNLDHNMGNLALLPLRLKQYQYCTDAFLSGGASPTPIRCTTAATQQPLHHRRYSSAATTPPLHHCH